MIDIDLSRWIVPIIAIGYLIFSIYRVILHRKLVKERREYEAKMKERMDQLQKDISGRARDLQDSMQMINQEYSQVMKSMGQQEKQYADQLVKKIEEHQEHLRASGQVKDNGQSTKKGSSSASSSQTKQPPKKGPSPVNPTKGATSPSNSSNQSSSTEPTSTQEPSNES